VKPWWGASQGEPPAGDALASLGAAVALPLPGPIPPQPCVVYRHGLSGGSASAFVSCTFLPHSAALAFFPQAS
jgi:hypothetical protein